MAPKINETSYPENCAAKIVHEIVADLSDRRGLRQEWEQIDSTIRREIVEVWTKIAIYHLKKLTTTE